MVLDHIRDPRTGEMLDLEANRRRHPDDRLVYDLAASEWVCADDRSRERAPPPEGEPLGDALDLEVFRLLVREWLRADPRAAVATIKSAKAGPVLRAH